MVSRIAPIVVFAALAAGCSEAGSGGSTLPVAVNVPNAPANGGTATAATQRVALTIKIPSTVGTSSNARKPLYISTGTQSGSFSVNGGTAVVANLTPSSPNCTSGSGGTTCTVTLAAPIGLDTFSASLYGQPNATGTALSQGKASQTIVAGQANTVALTLGGVINKLALTLSPVSPPVGTAATISLIVSALDASGATIIGSDTFVTPITLTDSDTSGATTLAISGSSAAPGASLTLNTPTDIANLVLKYNGTALAAATFNATSGAISATAVTLTPQGSTTVHFNDVTTFGVDNQRSGYNPNSTAITPTTVSSLHLAMNALLGGYGDFNVQSQPILATEIPNHQAVLFAGGASGTFSAHDALTGAKIWSKSTGQETFGCDPTQPSQTAVFGVGGTAVYDPKTNSLYVVANVNGASNSFAQNVLLRLDPATGATLGSYNFGAGQVGPSELNFSHTSITISNGIAYMGTGSTCDISSWRGRVAAVNVPAMTNAGTFFTVWDPNNAHGFGNAPWGGGGVWGWGGVTIDFAGNVLAGVGNTDNGESTNGTISAPFVASNTEYDAYGETLLEIASDMSHAVAYNHPISPSSYVNNVDLDVNGTPVVFQQNNAAGCDPMVALQSKAGALVLYDELHISNGPVRQFQFAPTAYSDGFLGVTAWSAATNLLYSVVASDQPPTSLNPGMVAINPGCGSPSITWHAAFGPDGTTDGIPRSVPAVSAGGVVFVATPCDDAEGRCATDGSASTPRGAVWELDASTGTILNNGKPILYTNAPIRAPATIDGNWVFIVDEDGDLYGLTIDPNYATIPTSAIRRSSVRHHVSRSKKMNGGIPT